MKPKTKKGDDTTPITRGDLAEFAEYIIQRFDTRMDKLEEELRAVRQDIASIMRRLDALEEAVHDIRGYTKEIDWLRSEVQALQKRVVLLEKNRTVSSR